MHGLTEGKEKEKASVGLAGRRRRREKREAIDVPGKRSPRALSILTDKGRFGKEKVEPSAVSVRWTQEHGFSVIESIVLRNLLNYETVEVSRDGTIKREAYNGVLEEVNDGS